MCRSCIIFVLTFSLATFTHHPRFGGELISIRDGEVAHSFTPACIE